MFRKTVFILIFAVIVSITGACSQSGDDKIENTGINTSDSKGSGPILKIYQLRSPILGQSFISSAVVEFNIEHSNIKMELVVFSDEQIAEFKNRMATEINTGEGPDIIVFGKGYPFSFKFMENGALYDLEKLFQNDPELISGAYNQAVFDSSKYKGKRYVIPCGYMLPLLFTVPSAAKSAGLPNNAAEWTWTEFVDFAKQFAQNNVNKEKYLFDTGFSLLEFIKFSGYKFINYDKKTSNLNSPEFEKLLAAYKEIYPSVCPEDVRKNYRGNYYSMLKDGKIAMVYSNQLASLLELLGKNSAVNEFLKEEMLVYPFPSYNNSGTTGILQNLVAISAKCKYPNEAFQFIKLLLSERMQKKSEENHYSSNKSTSSYAMPVLNSCFDKDKTEFMNPLKNTGEKYSDAFEGFTNASDQIFFNSVPLPQKLVDSVESINSSVKEYRFQEEEVLGFIGETLPDFLSGKISAKQAAEEMHAKVTLYLNE